MKTASQPSRPDASPLPQLSPAEYARQWKGVKKEYPAVAASYLLLVEHSLELRKIAGLLDISDYAEIIWAGDPPAAVQKPVIDCGHMREGQEEDWFRCMEKRIAQATP